MTVSDTRGPDTDGSGDAIETILREYGAESVLREWCRDGVEEVASAICRLAEEADVLLTTGGTGLAPRDQTPEGTVRAVDRLVPGLAELLRSAGAAETQFSWLSRGVVGIRGATLVANLPGSVNGAASGTRVLAPLLPHIVEQIRGGGHHDASD